MCVKKRVLEHRLQSLGLLFGLHKLSRTNLSHDFQIGWLQSNSEFPTSPEVLTPLASRPTGQIWLQLGRSCSILIEAAGPHSPQMPSPPTDSQHYGIFQCTSDAFFLSSTRDFFESPSNRSKTKTKTKKWVRPGCYFPHTQAVSPIDRTHPIGPLWELPCSGQMPGWQRRQLFFSFILYYLIIH